MVIHQKLATGTTISAWDYDGMTAKGQTIAARNDATKEYHPLIRVESVEGADGPRNRIVIKKSEAEKLGWTIVEE